MTPAAETPPPRTPLSRDRVLQSALDIADTGGISSLTIRSLAHDLGVKPMSVYHYVSGKDEIIDSIVDFVYGEIELPTIGGDWESEMRRRATSARQVLRRHPWSIALLQSRLRPGPSTVRHHNAVIGCLREGGFSTVGTAHAFALIDSFVHGFVLSETALPIHGPDAVADTAGAMVQQHLSSDDHPYLLEFVQQQVMQPDYDFGAEFDYGLDVVLGGFSARLE